METSKLYSFIWKSTLHTFQVPKICTSVTFLPYSFGVPREWCFWQMKAGLPWCFVRVENVTDMNLKEVLWVETFPEKLFLATTKVWLLPQDDRATTAQFEQGESREIQGRGENVSALAFPGLSSSFHNSHLLLHFSAPVSRHPPPFSYYIFMIFHYIFNFNRSLNFPTFTSHLSFFVCQLFWVHKVATKVVLQ